MPLETQEGGAKGPADLQEAPQPVASLFGGSVEAQVEQEGPPGEEQAPPRPATSEASADEAGYDQPKRGEVRQGTVVSVRPGGIVVDVRAKRECVVAASDLQKLGAGQIHEGDEVSVYIVRLDDREGHVVGSLYLAEVEKDWARAEEYAAAGRILEGKVTGQNRGGLLVPFGRLRGFVPASHMVGSSSEQEGSAVAASHWIGRTLPFKVIEVNRRRNRLILSYRVARRQWRSQRKANLLEGLQEGDVRRGVVSSLASFGAFVDLGGADGLIHISEIAWYRVEHVSELLQVGQEVEVYVLRVEPARSRVGLSLKRLQPDPWTLAAEKYAPGQTVQARITKLVDFGAFAEIEKGVEGLIHISELADPAPARPEEAVQPGQACLLRVLRVEPQGRRIGLSLRAVGPQDLERWQAETESGAEAEADE